MTMRHYTRKRIVSAIYFITVVATFAALWQIVRFCQGHVDAPGLDTIISITNHMLGAELNLVTNEFLSKAIYYFVGIWIWLAIAVIALVSGTSLTRITETYFPQKIGHQ